VLRKVGDALEVLVILRVHVRPEASDRPGRERRSHHDSDCIVLMQLEERRDVTRDEQLVASRLRIIQNHGGRNRRNARPPSVSSSTCPSAPSPVGIHWRNSTCVVQATFSSWRRPCTGWRRAAVPKRQAIAVLFVITGLDISHPRKPSPRGLSMAHWQCSLPWSCTRTLAVQSHLRSRSTTSRAIAGCPSSAPHSSSVIPRCRFRR